MNLYETVISNVNKDEPKLVDDKYIKKNIFNKTSLGKSILDSYKNILKYANTIDNVNHSLNTSIEPGIYLFTLDELNNYISKLVGSSKDFCKVRYKACRGLSNYVPAVKDLKNYLETIFKEENGINNMTEPQRITKYQEIYKKKYNYLPNEHMGEIGIRDAAFNAWLGL